MGSVGWLLAIFGVAAAGVAVGYTASGGGSGPSPQPTPTPTPQVPLPTGPVCLGTLITPGTMFGVSLPASSCPNCVSLYYCPPVGSTVQSVTQSPGDTTTIQVSGANGTVGQFGGAGTAQEQSPGQVFMKVLATSKPGKANVVVNWTDVTGTKQVTTIPVTVTA